MSSRSRFAGSAPAEHETPHAREQTGLIFPNDEGTESGSLIFSRCTGEDGQILHRPQISFDQYEQDQVLQLTSSEQGQGDDRAETRVLMLTDHPA